tara:strand:+ start:863 stop:1621 length:759 start_codon:yes stop_codon:yes gene_type:complete
MEIIDFNVHFSDNGDWFGQECDGIEAFIKIMEKSQINKAVILPLKVNCSSHFVIECCRKFPDSFYGFGTISLDNYESEIDLILKNNLKGCKYHPRFQNGSITLLEKKGILRELEINNIPIAICCWPQVKNKNLNISDASPLIIDRMAKKYPKLIFIILHLGGHNLWDAIFCARSNENVFLDCSYFFKFFAGTSLENDFWIMADRIDEKVIYGSDYPEVDVIKNLEYVKGKAFEMMRYPEKLFSGNFLKIINT